MTSPKSVLIVGSGVIGLSAAWYLIRRGCRVTLVDRVAADHEGCSFGNAGLIVPSHFVPFAAPGMVALGLKWMWNPESPFYIQPRLDKDLCTWARHFWRAATASHVSRSAPLLRDLHLASRACFQELASQPDADFGLVKKGLLMLCKNRRTLDHEGDLAAEANRLGILAQVLDARQTADLEPDVEMEIAGSVFFPGDCHLAPARFIASLRSGIEKAGGTFLWETEVTHWQADGRRVRSVHTTRGELSADEFLLAGGAWSAATARDLTLDLPLQAGKGYSLTLPTPPRLPRTPAILTEARVAVTPIGSTLRFGGTMELAGLNETINPARIRGIVQTVPRYYPAFRPSYFDGVRPWCGLRPCSPDGLPYVGRTARYENLAVATGHGMLGISLGPVTGKLIAEVLSDEQPSLDISLLNPDRYG